MENARWCILLVRSKAELKYIVATVKMINQGRHCRKLTLSGIAQKYCSTYVPAMKAAIIRRTAHPSAMPQKCRGFLDEFFIFNLRSREAA